MNLILWTLVLLASVWAAHWGADQLANPLQKLRKQWGLNEAAGAALVALATASPEIGTNTASALQGLSDIGLGNLLGSNIISVPVIVGVAYIASQGKTSSFMKTGPIEKFYNLNPRPYLSRQSPTLLSVSWQQYCCYRNLGKVYSRSMAGLCCWCMEFM